MTQNLDSEFIKHIVENTDWKTLNKAIGIRTAIYKNCNMEELKNISYLVDFCNSIRHDIVKMGYKDGTEVFGHSINEPIPPTCSKSHEHCGDCDVCHADKKCPTTTTRSEFFIPQFTYEYIGIGKRENRIIELKCDPDPFDAIWHDAKRFEYRRTKDRNFQPGDILYLRRYDRDAHVYTGRRLYTAVTYVLSGPAYGLDKDTCILSLSLEIIRMSE